MRHNRYFYVEKIYKFKKNWYKKKLGKSGEKEVKKQIEVLLMYEYYRIRSNRTLKHAANIVKNGLSMKVFTPNRLGLFGTQHQYDAIKKWYETHKHLLKLQ